MKLSAKFVVTLNQFSAFRRFGVITDIRHFKSQGYSFVKFDTKESACRAIVDMNGAELMGRTF